MGEKIADLGHLQIGNTKFTVELNYGARKDGPKDVHIQNDLGRMNLSEREYLTVLGKLVTASRKLAQTKIG